MSNKNAFTKRAIYAARARPHPPPMQWRRRRASALPFTAPSILPTRLRSERQSLIRRIRELEAENAALAELSVTDALTGAYNRRYLEVVLAHDARLRERTHTAALCVFDIDHFKLINDAYGHNAGDRVLRAVARAVTGGLRNGDEYLFRLGGDEFCVLLFADSAHETLSVVECLQQAVRSLEPPQHELQGHALTISMGVVWRAHRQGHEHEPPATPWDMYQRADQMLYAAKRAGRNRIEFTTV
ncbi:GGDEF domain-containing protein [Paraburkholderia bannensis]|uniref:GGDEF domain-containing protein n=1 Tax=Paraburkholderia bannensis TaxID=765414 RepID=UPI002AB633CC|nr:GGDEF domain-containing protein [Paraburkholderia bannensis]